MNPNGDRDFVAAILAALHPSPPDRVLYWRSVDGRAVPVTAAELPELVDALDPAALEWLDLVLATAVRLVTVRANAPGRPK